MSRDIESLEIAVIGKSSSGKSAFIKSFSNYPDLITSEGKGQTTRAYGEYVFHNEVGGLPKVYVEMYTEDLFVEQRTDSSYEKIKELLEDEDYLTFSWLIDQYEDDDFKREIDEAIIFQDEFFNINEFGYLNEIKVIDDLLDIYNEFVKIITNVKDLKKMDLKYISLEETEKYVNYESINGSENREGNLIKELLEALFLCIYQRLIEEVRVYYSKLNVYKEENDMPIIDFEVSADKKGELSRFLKVINTNNLKESLTGIISKVRVSSFISSDYKDIFDRLGVERITLIDTYGLDHEQQLSEKILRDRYNRIFNIDYPEITVTFYVEALHAGSSVDFSNSMITLYEVRPDIMSYVIATYIDSHDEEFIKNNLEWLTADNKDSTAAPLLNGKVIDFLYRKGSIKSKLKRSNVSEVLAGKRQEVMRNKFGPFCGYNEYSKQYMDEINSATISSVFTSIMKKEHLGNQYIQIDNVIKMTENKKIIKSFLMYMIERSTDIFKSTHDVAASRTKGKIRKNLRKFILGFDGTTLDATWRSMLNYAFNQTFTKEVIIGDNRTSLSTEFGLEGNEKLAFDETLNKSFRFLFNKKCAKADLLNSWEREVKCYKCSKAKAFDNSCMWGLLINIAGVEEFTNSKAYGSVIEWLNNLHAFNDKINDTHYEFMISIFSQFLKEAFVPLARYHNYNIASDQIKLSDKPYLEEKKIVFNDYKMNYDSEINEQDFYKNINSFM